MRIRMGAVVLALLLSGSALAQTLYDGGPPPDRVVHRNTLALRVNPLGLLYDGRFSARARLYASDSTALRDNFVGLGLAPTLSPAFFKVGPYLEFNPATVFGLWAALQLSQYFGTMNLLQSFPSANSRFSDAAIADRGTLPAGDPQRGYATQGFELSLGAHVTLKLWMLVLRSQARAVFGSLGLRAGDTIYYDQFFDVAVPNQGWFVTNDLDVLWQSADNKFVGGARYTLTAPLYTARHVAPGEDVPDNSMHRLGPFLAYTFRVRDGAAFNTPTVFLVVQWWLKHRYRTGQEVHAALPMIGAGFQVTGDFLPFPTQAPTVAPPEPAPAPAPPPPPEAAPQPPEAAPPPQGAQESSEAAPP